MDQDEVKRLLERKERLIDAKEVALHAAFYSIMADNMTQREKSLLALASVGIGLLISILSTEGAGSIWAVVFMGISLFCFLTTIILAFICFTANKDKVKFQFKPPTLEVPKEESFWSKKMLWWDYGASVSFTIAVLALIAFGVAEASVGSQAGEEVGGKMTQKRIVQSKDKDEKSLGDLKIIKPEDVDRKLPGVEDAGKEDGKEKDK